MTKFLFFTFMILFCVGQQANAAPTTNVSASEVAKVEAEAKRVSKEHKIMEQKANKLKEELKNVNQKMLKKFKTAKTNYVKNRMNWQFYRNI